MVLVLAEQASLFYIAKKAIKKAKAETNKPSIIICKTKIGYGAPNEGSSDTHGAPLGAEKTAILRANLGYEYAPFEVASEVYAHTKKAINRGKKAEREWKKLFADYSAKYPELANKVTEKDYDELVDYAIDLGVENGFIQEGETASESFIPDFLHEV